MEFLGFKRGDKAVINVDDPCHSPLKQGDVVKILDVHQNEVEVESTSGVSWWVMEGDLDLFIALPKGDQLSLGPISAEELGCDCGGYKTFKSMAPQYHSQSLPCSSLKAKK